MLELRRCLTGAGSHVGFLRSHDLCRSRSRRNSRLPVAAGVARRARGHRVSRRGPLGAGPAVRQRGAARRLAQQLRTTMVDDISTLQRITADSFAVVLAGPRRDRRPAAGAPRLGVGVALAGGGRRPRYPRAAQPVLHRPLLVAQRLRCPRPTCFPAATPPTALSCALGAGGRLAAGLARDRGGARRARYACVHGSGRADRGLAPAERRHRGGPAAFAAMAVVAAFLAGSAAGRVRPADRSLAGVRAPRPWCWLVAAFLSRSTPPASCASWPITPTPSRRHRHCSTPPTCSA